MPRGHREALQVICPRCKHTEIVYLPIEDLPLCPECQKRMIILELLDEGKYF